MGEKKSHLFPSLTYNLVCFQFENTINQERMIYILEYYKQLREDSIKVQNHIFSLYEDIYMIPTLHTFQVIENNTVNIKNEGEESALMDFSIYAQRIGGALAIERYDREQREVCTPRMSEFVQVALQNEVILARVEHVDREDGTIELTGLLGDQKDKEYCLADWGLSQTVTTNLIIFLRFIPFPTSFQERDYYGNIGMGSGVSYIFLHKNMNKILRKGRTLTQKYKRISNLKLRKQIVFFYLNREFGFQKKLI